METLLLATLSPVVYIVMGLTFARAWFRKYPWRSGSGYGTEYYMDLNERIATSAFMGFFWPVALPVTLICIGVKRYIAMPSRTERHAAEEAMTLYNKTNKQLTDIARRR
jgi:hypothetical protein